MVEWFFFLLFIRFMYFWVVKWRKTPHGMSSDVFISSKRAQGQVQGHYLIRKMRDKYARFPIKKNSIYRLIRNSAAVCHFLPAKQMPKQTAGWTYVNKIVERWWQWQSTRLEDQTPNMIIGLNIKIAANICLTKRRQFVCKHDLFRLFDAKNISISGVILKSNGWRGWKLTQSRHEK